MDFVQIDDPVFEDQIIIGFSFIPISADDPCFTSFERISISDDGVGVSSNLVFTSDDDIVKDSDFTKIVVNFIQGSINFDHGIVDSLICFVVFVSVKISDEDMV